MTTRAFADALGTDPKTLRKFLRASTPRDQHPGKGGRWVLPGTKSAISSARKSFAKWQADEAKKAAERAATAAKDAESALRDAEETPDEVEETPAES